MPFHLICVGPVQISEYFSATSGVTEVKKVAVA